MRGDEEDKQEKKRREEAAQNSFLNGMQMQSLRESWFAAKDTFSALPAFWLLVFCAVGVAAAVNALVPPFQKLIPPMRDPSLSYPVGDEQVPEYLVAVLAVLFPTAVIILVSHFQDKSDIGVSLLALAQSCGYTMLSTVLLKKVAGRPRPCFYDMCEWVQDSVSGSIGTETGHCTGARKRVWEARQSFPSGHSSLSFAGLFFLSLFLLDKLALHLRRAPPALPFPRQLQLKALQITCLVPAGLACWIAETRTQDYWHNYDDIVAGAAVGAGFALWSFQQREALQGVVREALRAPGARSSDEMAPMREGEASAEENA